jgi:hypothetical protein
VKRLALITVILGSALALAPVGSAMVSDSGGGTVSTTSKNVNAMNPATQAVLLRSEGLANYYGSPYTKSLLLQSQALADYYSNHTTAAGVTFHTDTLGGKGAPDSLPADTGNSFDWGNALAVTLAAMLILAIAATTITRRRHRLSF